MMCFNGTDRMQEGIGDVILKMQTECRTKLEKAIRYSEEHGVDKETLMAVAGAANAKIDYNAFEKGEWNMCTLFEEIAEEGREEGRIEGMEKGKEEGMKKGREEGRAVEIIEMGIEFQLKDADILERLQKKLNISLQKAREYFGMFGNCRG